MIAAGRTNQNFRVTAGDHTYFARVGHDLPHHGISRANELRCLRLAAAARVAPEIVYASDGVLVTEFIEGATLSQGEAVDDETLLLLARALRCLHDTTAPTDLHSFDPVEICRRDSRALPAKALSTERRRRIDRALDYRPVLRGQSLIHADLIPENVMISDRRVVLVDWEYAGSGDPAVDIASVVLHFGLGERQADLLVAGHGAIDVRSVRALLPILALREALWCEVQRQFAGLQGDLAAYSEMCWRRLERMTA